MYATEHQGRRHGLAAERSSAARVVFSKLARAFENYTQVLTHPICNQSLIPGFVRGPKHGTYIAASTSETARVLPTSSAIMYAIFWFVVPGTIMNFLGALPLWLLAVVVGFDRPIVTNVRVDGCRGGGSSRE